MRAARSLDIGGSGLGLAIVRSIMSSLGGSIVATAVERGAEFTAVFPAAADDQAAWVDNVASTSSVLPLRNTLR